MPLATSSTRVLDWEFVIMASGRPRPQEGEQIEVPGRLAVLRQRHCGLAPELGPVIDDVNEQVPEDVLERHALRVLVRELRGERTVGERRQIRAHLSLFVGPAGL